MELTQQVTFWAKSISNPCSRHANTFALNHELDKIECGLLKLHESSKNSALVQKKLDEILHNIKEYRVMSEEKETTTWWVLELKLSTIVACYDRN